MTVGGFPRAIAEFLQRGRVGDAFFEDISAWLHRDIDMNAPQESISRLTQGWRAETRVIAGRYGRGVVATKNIVDVAGDVWALPAPMLAMFLG